MRKPFPWVCIAASTSSLQQSDGVSTVAGCLVDQAAEDEKCRDAIPCNTATFDGTFENKTNNSVSKHLCQQNKNRGKTQVWTGVVGQIHVRGLLPPLSFLFLSIYANETLVRGNSRVVPSRPVGDQLGGVACHSSAMSKATAAQSAATASMPAMPSVEVANQRASSGMKLQRGSFLANALVMLASVFAITALHLHPTVSSPRSHLRCAVPRLQSLAAREVTCEAELNAAIPEAPLTILMLSMRGCAKAAKVKKFLAERHGDKPDVQHLAWQLDAEDEEATAQTLGALRCSRTPFCIAFDSDGSRLADFVAETPSALFYGLEGLGGLLAAMDEAGMRGDAASSEATAAPRSSGGGGGGGSGNEEALRLAALEQTVSDLQLQLSVQRADLFAANQRIAALEAKDSADK